MSATSEENALHTADAVAAAADQAPDLTSSNLSPPTLPIANHSATRAEPTALTATSDSTRISATPSFLANLSTAASHATFAATIGGYLARMATVGWVYINNPATGWTIVDFFRAQLVYRSALAAGAAAQPAGAAIAASLTFIAVLSEPYARPLLTRLIYGDGQSTQPALALAAPPNRLAHADPSANPLILVPPMSNASAQWAVIERQLQPLPPFMARVNPLSDRRLMLAPAAVLAANPLTTHAASPRTFSITDGGHVLRANGRIIPTVEEVDDDSVANPAPSPTDSLEATAAGASLPASTEATDLGAVASSATAVAVAATSATTEAMVSAHPSQRSAAENARHAKGQPTKGPTSQPVKPTTPAAPPASAAPAAPAARPAPAAPAAPAQQPVDNSPLARILRVFSDMANAISNAFRWFISLFAASSPSAPSQVVHVPPSLDDQREHGRPPHSTSAPTQRWPSTSKLPSSNASSLSCNQHLHTTRSADF